MQKIIKIVLSVSISLFLLNFISASDCSKAFYFLVDNPGASSNQIGSFIKLNNLSVTQDFFYNIETNCNVSLPKVIKNLSELVVFNNSKTCSTDIGSKIANFDLDWSIPFTKVDTPLSCGWVNNLKFFLRIEKVDNNTFISGLKIWWIVFLVLFMFFTILYLILRRTNKYLKSN